MAGIYFHIPFCKRICSYCDFYRTAQLKELPEVVEKMCEEVKDRADYLPDKQLKTIYFGGGTPSLLSPEQLAQLLKTTRAHFDCSEVEETTLEANPDDLTAEYLQELRRMGINRLSIGIQSFDNDCLKLMNRRHTAEEAIAAVKAAQQAGFDNLTIDLIFGVPGFGGEKLERSIETALSLGVQHISAYLLTIEERTRFGRMVEKGELQEISDETAEAEYLLIHKRLTDAGMEHYEVSNYALPSFRARHNSHYWDATPYLGIGPGAHSFDGVSRQWNVASTTRYLQGEPPERELLGEEEMREEFLMTRLRTADGFSLDEAAEHFGEEYRNRLEKAAQRLIQEGLLHEQAGHLRIPPEKLLLSDYVIGSMFDL